MRRRRRQKYESRAHWLTDVDSPRERRKRVLRMEAQDELPPEIRKAIIAKELEGFYVHIMSYDIDRDWDLVLHMIKSIKTKSDEIRFNRRFAPNLSRL